jgi:ankyrin repeat protein
VTSLHWAAEYGHVEVVRVLLAAGAEVNVKTNVSMYGISQYSMDESIMSSLEGQHFIGQLGMVM